MSLQLRATSLVHRACPTAAMQRTLGTTLRRLHNRPTLPPKSRFHAGYQGIVQHRIEHSKRHSVKIQSREKWTRTKEHSRKEQELEDAMLYEELRNRSVLERFLAQGEWAGMLYPERPRDASGNLLPLHNKQQGVMKLVLEDEQNVFFTGPAGSGKSMLLRELIAALEEKYPTQPNRVQVCVVTDLVNEQALGKNLEEARVVVFDSISKMRPGEFVHLDRLAQRLHGNDKPFGGLQIVATGDFAQQPRHPALNSKYGAFCFEAPNWPLFKHQVTLSRVFRQKEDPKLVRMLNGTRNGRVTKSDMVTLEQLNRELPVNWHNLKPVVLSSSPTEVGEVNRAQLDRLGGEGYMYRLDREGYVYHALVYLGQDFPKARTRLMDQCIVPDHLLLKLGTQVMLIKNLADDPRLTIGTIGQVVAFHDADLGEFTRPEVRFVLLDGSTVDRICTEETWKADCYVPGYGRKIIASKKQIPLVHAWALTVDAAQGLTLPRVEVDLAQEFNPGELYAALSRAPATQYLRAANFTGEPKGSPSDQILAFHRTLRSPLNPPHHHHPSSMTNNNSHPHRRLRTAVTTSPSSPSPDTP